MEKCNKCRKKSHIYFECTICEKIHCLKHRYPESHVCLTITETQKEEKKVKLEKIIPKKIDKI